MRSAGILILVLCTLAGAVRAQPAEEPRQTFILQSQSDDPFDLMAPGYFITGFERNPDANVPTQNNQVRIQLPVRYRMSAWDRVWGWVPGDLRLHLYFAFTYDAFWNLYDESAPFYDSNYAPEAYVYLWNHGWPVSGAFGVKHHSNGQADPLSRSWNRWYFALGWGDPLKNAFFGSARVWDAWGVDDNNANIEDYLGRGEVDMFFVPGAIWTPTKWGMDRLSLRVKSALGGIHFVQNVEASLFIRVTDADWFRPNLMVQYFDGTGLMLRDYDQHLSVWRVGLALMPNAASQMR